jgi:hypothetical protein
MVLYQRDKAALSPRAPKPGGNIKGLGGRDSPDLSGEGFLAPKSFALEMGPGAPARSALECGVTQERRFVARDNAERSKTGGTSGAGQRKLA